MLKKGSKLYSILTGSCPKCHEESMYKEKNPYKMGEIFEMHEKCSHCLTRYKMEPSFFYGAMYVSYGVTVAVSITAFIISFVIFDLGINAAFISIILSLIITFPLALRVSRNIWINFFIHYDKNWKTRNS